MIESMIYGKATVEVVERECYMGGSSVGEIIEPAYMKGLVWVRYTVSSFCQSRSKNGYCYDIVGLGGSSWSHSDNVRNFIRIS